MFARALWSRAIVRTSETVFPKTRAPKIDLDNLDEHDLNSVTITKDYLSHLESIAYADPTNLEYTAEDRKKAYNDLVVGTKIYNIRATERHRASHERYDKDFRSDRRKKRLAFYGVTFGGLIVSSTLICYLLATNYFSLTASVYCFL